MSTIKDEIEEQLLFGHACIKFAEELYKIIQEKRSKLNTYKEIYEYINHANIIQIQLIANFYVERAILELDTLLSKKKRDKSLWCVALTDGSKTSLEAIRESYEKSEVIKCRGSFVAHTNAKMKGSPALGKIFSVYKPEIRGQIMDFYSNINNFWGAFVGNPFGNNYFFDKFISSLSEFSKMLDYVGTVVTNKTPKNNTK